MSSGTWKPGETKDRTGLYNWFVSLATSRINAAKKGVVGIPIKADWGPCNQLTICSDDTDIISTFGDGGTVYLARRAAKGGKDRKPHKLVIYRMATAEAEQAVATVEGSFKLIAKYKGERGNHFRASITENIQNEDCVNLCIYEDSAMVSKYTIEKGDLDALVEAVNNDAESLVTAVRTGETPLSPTAPISFAGGASGSEVRVEDYIKALTAFETAYMNTLALDGVTDEAILTMVKSWHNRVWNTGKMIQLVIGGTHADDKEPDIGNTRSKSCDNYGIINCIVGGIDAAGNMYSSAEMAPQIAGAVAALPLNASITYKQLEDIVDVTVELTDTQICEATRAGSFVLFKDTDPESFEVKVKVERGINTFTSFGKEAGQKLRKIKAISTMAAIDYDIGRYAMNNVLGELDNDADGRAALFSGVSQYLETLANEHVISPDILVGLSEALVSEGDVVYMETQALTIDKIEQIFNKIYL